MGGGIFGKRYNKEDKGGGKGEEEGGRRGGGGGREGRGREEVGGRRRDRGGGWEDGIIYKNSVQVFPRSYIYDGGLPQPNL